LALERVERRVAADVAGYSRLMGENEAGTLGRLKALRRELIDPQIAEHRGRIVRHQMCLTASGVTTAGFGRSNRPRTLTPT
jgi:class 3 adenylate cyclase